MKFGATPIWPQSDLFQQLGASILLQREQGVYRRSSFRADSPFLAEGQKLPGTDATTQTTQSAFRVSRRTLLTDMSNKKGIINLEGVYSEFPLFGVSRGSQPQLTYCMGQVYRALGFFTWSLPPR